MTPYALRTPWLDRRVAKAVGRILVWLARRAAARDDFHEFKHLRAAVDAGNSRPCERAGNCRLDSEANG